ncbi:MAG: hypothetical protein BWY63_03130 [Chloroflexi bacterium ADurb.Bin360]|nr:MAG: hypothetical protein BWY63_03130 [Chloroflexi bacterium ADurb.Bin360]
MRFEQRNLAINCVGGALFDQYTLSKQKQAICKFCQLLRRMARHHHCHPLLTVERAQNTEDFSSASGIELRGRFIEYQNCGFHSQRGSNCQALLLPAGELMGMAAFQSRQAHHSQHASDALPDNCAWCAQVFQRKGDFVLYRGGSQLRLGVFENHAHPRRKRMNRLLDRVQPCHKSTPKETPPVKLGHNAVKRQTKCGLARASRTNQANKLSALNFQRNITQSQGLRARILIGKALQHHKRSRHG